MTNQTLIKLLASALFLGAVATASASTWYPSPNGGAAVAVGQTLVSNGGDVTVTFLGPTNAGYTEHLFVSTPTIATGPAAGGAHFFDNHATANGATVDLGVIAAGTEIVFGLYVDTTGNTFYDGPASRNPDGVVHAYLVSNYPDIPGSTYVGFEDLWATVADFNYVDEVFAFSNTSVAGAPDSSTTVSLLGLSLLGLAFATRRLKR